MKRSKFSLSHYVLGSSNMGYVLPVGLVEVLPGDTVQHSLSIFMRLAPMLAPVMHPVICKIHHWYVPHRLVWDEFEDFITGGPDGLNVSVLPKITFSSGVAVGSLGDYLGLPTGFNGIQVSALPFRAYNLIYNEWYRDQDLEDPVVISLDSGPDSTTSTALLRGDWARDYFTTARPWPQKGPAVSVPVNSPAQGNITISPDGGFVFTNPVSLGGTGAVVNVETATGGAQDRVGFSSDQIYANVTGNSGLQYYTGLKAEFTGSGDIGSVDINALREAMALQRFEEHRSMYGSRYVEYLRYLGIKASDARLQRPEYLGGGSQTIQFSEVLQTAEGTDPVGTLRGHGISAMRSNRYRRFIEEHGYIISVLLIRPKSIYQQGIARTWLRSVKEDFWQRELQHIGQQEVLTSELYGGSPGDEVFGYQNRYDEYRSMQSRVSGEFRNTLDYWHFSRIFSNKPTLNADFISSVPTKRPFAAQQNDVIYFLADHSIQARRLMSRYGNPM